MNWCEFVQDAVVFFGLRLRTVNGRAERTSGPDVTVVRDAVSRTLIKRDVRMLRRLCTNWQFSLQDLNGGAVGGRMETIVRAQLRPYDAVRMWLAARYESRPS